MRRALPATAAIVALVAVSFGVGWVVSASDERTVTRHHPAVVRLKPLPVPRVVIPNGPWADPRPTATVPVHVAPVMPHGLLAELGWLLGFTSFVRVEPGPG
ncbi:hypothetical protein [Aeromicrobium sp. 9AM]|uniref:hypothetical protein n=1 Tax=Aeromicrobium sp. 9AM TaxID=2653126 RepID=UPI00135CD755|nr:hypothetical protein [Aeromicrobium sp. 9AM]